MQLEPFNWTARRHKPFPKHHEIRIASPGKGEQATTQTAFRQDRQDQLEMAAYSSTASFRHLQDIKTLIICIRHHQAPAEACRQPESFRSFIEGQPQKTGNLQNSFFPGVDIPPVGFRISQSDFESSDGNQEKEAEQT